MQAELTKTSRPSPAVRQAPGPALPSAVPSALCFCFATAAASWLKLQEATCTVPQLRWSICIRRESVLRLVRLYGMQDCLTEGSSMHFSALTCCTALICTCWTPASGSCIRDPRRQVFALPANLGHNRRAGSAANKQASAAL